EIGEKRVASTLGWIVVLLVSSRHKERIPMSLLTVEDCWICIYIFLITKYSHGFVEFYTVLYW
ncbi:MAG: hypothetical protein ACOVP5_03065, partial [Chitinophagales bacterium]